MKVESYQLLDFAKKALLEMGIHDYESVKLTYVMKNGPVWEVNFLYKERYSTVEKKGCFAVNATTGEFDGIWLDRIWT